MMLLGQGKLEAATQLCAQVLQDRPDMPQARFAEALIDRQAGRVAKAIATLEALHAELPEHPAIRAELASTRVMGGQAERAIPVLEEIAAAAPDQPFAHYWLGQAYLRSFQGPQAVACLERVREISPEDRNIMQPLAAAYLAVGKPALAEDILRDLLSTDPNHIEGLNSLAAALEHLNRLPESGEQYRKVLEIAPDNGRAISGLARVLQTEGKRDEAREMLRQHFEQNTPHPTVISTFAALCETSQDRQACLRAARDALSQPQLTAQDRTALLFAAARLLDAESEHDEAFTLYAQGNALSPKLYSPAEKERHTADIIATFSSNALSSMPRAMERSDRPVFIVGMPRSGTTLVEQILAAHPDVHAAGELQELRRIWRELIADPGRGSITNLSRLTQAQTDAASKRYLDFLDSLDAEAPRVTDKMPHNFEQLGLVQLLFPDAKVIHCRRNPLDNCVSCFTVQLGPAHSFSNDLATLGHAYGQHELLMKHWRSTLEIPMLEVVYEHVVDDIETAARQIVEFVGLPWNDACLRFYEADRAVTTASVDQVRKPIYNSSVARWKRYENHLAPLRHALEQAGVALSDPE